MLFPAQVHFEARLWAPLGLHSTIPKVSGESSDLRRESSTIFWILGQGLPLAELMYLMSGLHSRTASDQLSIRADVKLEKQSLRQRLHSRLTKLFLKTS